MSLQWIPAWFTLFPLVAAMVLTWVWTSYFWLRVVRIPAATAVVVAPAVTTTIIFVLSHVYHSSGFFWSGARVLPVLVLVGAAGLLTYLAVIRKWGPIPTRALQIGPRVSRSGLESDPSRPGRLPATAFGIACIFGWVMAILPTILTSAPDNPVQQWDPSFHMNGIWGINHLGIAASGEGLAHNFGGADSRAYPIAWHAFTSLFSTPTTVVSTANASSLALMAVWVVSVGVYARVLYPGRIVALAAPIIGGLLPSMPADALTMYSQWPNAMSVALLPGIAALAVTVGRVFLVRCTANPGDEHPVIAPGWKAFAAMLVALVLATYGGIEAHPAVAFNALVLLGPAVVAGAALLWRSASMTRRRWIRSAVVVTGALGVTVIVLVNFTPQVTSARNYHRDGVDLQTAISQVLAPVPPFPSTIGLTIAAGTFTVLAVIAIIRILVSRYSTARWAWWPNAPKPVLWPVWSYILFLVLVFFAYGPNWAVRTWFVGPWFNDGRRIMEPMSIALVVLAAVGFEWTVLWIVRWWNMSLDAGTARQRGVAAGTMGLILLLGTVIGGLDGRVAAARTVFDVDHLGKSGMATGGVLDMMRRMPTTLPEDAVVLGDPQAGGVYVQMIGQRWAYFPQLTLLNANRDQQEILVERFRELHEDPEVCQAIREAGITHFFSNSDGAYYGRMRSDRMPGLYNVDTRVGFELVDQGDEAKLYKITACDISD